MERYIGSQLLARPKRRDRHFFKWQRGCRLRPNDASGSSKRVSDEAATGWTVLGNLFGPSYGSRADGVSADGSVVVGEADSPTGPQAFIWDQTDGMRLLQPLLVRDGVTDLSSWALTDGNDISANGQTIVGDGIDPAGNPEGWVATLPVPEPCSLGLLAVGVTALQLRRPRRTR